jgi:uncharacterized protein YkwD
VAGHALQTKPRSIHQIQMPRSASVPFSLGLCLALLLLSSFALSLSAFAAGDPTTAASTANGASGPNASFGSLGHLELAMWTKVNQDRTSPSVQDETKGLAKPLQWDVRLAAVAREHSEEMAATGNFSHRGADGGAPMTRVSKAGVCWLATGENIAKIDLGSGFVPVSEATANEQVVTKAEALFMAEPKFKPNHRGNILNPAYNRVGIGIARAADGSFYITQEFAQVR